MKIPAKSHASILQDAYVQKVRKNLEPEIKQRAGELEDEEAKQLAEKKAEEPLPSDEKLNEMMDKTMATPQPNLSAKETDIPEGTTLNDVIERTFAAAEAPDDDISVSAPDEEENTPESIQNPGQEGKEENIESFL